MNMDKETVQKIVVMYLSSNEETKQEIKNVLKYLDMLVKVKSGLLLIDCHRLRMYN
jgi:HPt (histidine-containing phosphotransfer) domain-containing protein